MNLDDEEIKKTKKIGKGEIKLEEAIKTIKEERYDYIVPGCRLDNAIDRIVKEIFIGGKKDDK